VSAKKKPRGRSVAKSVAEEKHEKWDVQACITNIFDKLSLLEDMANDADNRITDLESKVHNSFPVDEDEDNGPDTAYYVVQSKPDPRPNRTGKAIKQAKRRVKYFAGFVPDVVPEHGVRMLSRWTSSLDEAAQFIDYESAKFAVDNDDMTRPEAYYTTPEVCGITAEEEDDDEED
jgi:hypothetical protein